MGGRGNGRQRRAPSNPTTMRDALRKLQDARAAASAVRVSTDADSLRREFGSCLASLKTISNRLEAAGNQAVRAKGDALVRVNFERFWAAEKERERLDPLLVWLASARNDDIHVATGDPTLTFESDAEFTVIKPPPNASLVINPDGAWFVENPGTAREIRRPAGHPEIVGRTEFRFAVVNPPAEHLGKPIADNTLPGLLDALVAYFESLYDQVDQWISK